MCIFSGAVERVSNTRIFARVNNQNGATQVIVYQMKMSASDPMAMILPIPISKGTQDISFINLKPYPNFFSGLEALFPNFSKSMLRNFSLNATSDTLVVHEVGDYEASFVPTVADFSRLDQRFKMPDGTWDQIPDYADYGFAVFKLNQGVLQPAGGGFQMPMKPVPNKDDHEFHPMAFSFPTRMPDAVFFPTIHIHDGEIHKTGDFDHSLYLQAHTQAIQSAMEQARDWRKSSDRPGHRIGPAEIIDYSDFVYKAELRGNLTNIDTIIRV